MLRSLRHAIWACVALVLIAVTPAVAADRNISLLEGMDLPGGDYQVIKQTTLDACQSACVDDRICRAFTFNQDAGWCFLKGSAGEEAPFAAATSGRVSIAPAPEATEAVRQAELPFPAQDFVDAARRFASELPVTDKAPKNASYADLVAAGDENAADNPAAAIVNYRQALGLNGNDPEVWSKLADALLARADQEAQRTDSNELYDLAQVATSAALNAFLRSETRPERAGALARLAHALEFRDMWRETIATYRASLKLDNDAALSARLDKIVGEHGFRIASTEVDAEAATPRICVVFSDPLPTDDTDLSNYVKVEGAPQIAVETDYSQICIDGVEFGQRYIVTLRAGLPSADGEELAKDVDLNVFVPDRAPFVGFANNAYVLPAGLGGGLPISSVNAKTADLAIYRIGDRSIATAVRTGVFQGNLDGYSAEDVAENSGEKTWEGQIDLAQAAPNAMVTTAIPVAQIITDLQPGAYVITAKVAGVEGEYWDELATQWFIVTDMGLTTVSGDDGVHAFVRSLKTAAPVVGAKVRLVALNNEILGETETDAAGRADFAPGLARGEGGRAPQLLVAETDAGDYAFLDMAKAGFDLTDRGVEGRPSPGPLDVFATTERGVYRPGETVFLTALLRDNKAKAVTDLPLTMEVERPDGVVSNTEVLNDQGAGSYFAELPMVAEAMRGAWHLRLYADPKAEALANVTFLVEDFEPERLAFDITAPDTPFAADAPAEVKIAARYLYGATAPDLSIEADAVLRPVTTLSGYPGYTFGRLDDTMQANRESLGVVATTDESGNAIAEITLPEAQVTTRPLEAQLILRLVDTNGRPVERTITRPVAATDDRIGIKPQFDADDGPAEGSNAQFDVVVVDPQGETVARQGLKWTLSRVETEYQWYKGSDGWRWEPITSNREVANGTVDGVAGGPVTIGAPVDWGRYQLEVNTTGRNATSSSIEFYAGYYYAEAGSDTPDTLDVALDKTAYRPGDTATLRLDPQFAGTALVMVVDDGLIDLKAVDVPAEGTSVSLPVTEAWGPGAYVSAVLYRPADAAEKRMPARALGLAYADVDPGDMQLDIKLDVPRENRPRAPLSVKVDLGQQAAGQTAYVAVAAVDLGILNLTNFPIPDPDGWYFGQRQLGVEFRDLYGQLIDPLQGMPGEVRSGGDGGAARLGTPPPTSVLVAQHSGIVEVGADGTATVTFDMPDFNGTVRIMAMAWTAAAVGHASTDVIVRDPVVVTLSPPRFLRVGDESRLMVEINNVGGAAGSYGVSLGVGDGLSSTATDSTVELAQGARTSLTLPLTGEAIGDHDLTVTITPPDGGEPLVKTLMLGVRPTSGQQTTSHTVSIAPGESLTLAPDRFAEMLRGTGTLTLAVGPIARLDVPGVLVALDRYPYGCVEQTSSRALPLLYLNDVAKLIGMGSDDALDERVRKALVSVLAKQTSNGGFGLWSAFDSSDLWLDAYVTEFLLRAKDKGFDIPEVAMTMALDNLANQVSYASDFTDGGEGLAYALYDLARSGRAAIGDLRYYLEAKLDSFATPLAKAQLGAALALYGDNQRAATAFGAAVAGLDERDDPHQYRPDYGSQLRDTAAVLALAAEFKPDGVDIAELTGRLADLRDVARYTSTQEDVWTLLAAAQLGQQAANGTVTIDGEPLTGAVYRSFEREQIEAAPVVVTNTGTEPVEAKLSLTGYPATPPDATSAGFTVSRQYFLPDGTEFDPATEEIKQNDRFVVYLSTTVEALGSGQYLLVDPIPAGFEIENPNLAQSGGVADLAWLEVDTPVHTEARTDQFVAAFRYNSQTTSFTAAYMVRAVSPGTFAQPGATAEDMYRPELRGNTDAGTITVTAAGP